MKHIKYLKYILIHKWWVFYYSCKLGIPFRGLVHDLSKLLPSEWFPYVEAFYGYLGYRFINDNGTTNWKLKDIVVYGFIKYKESGSLYFVENTLKEIHNKVMSSVDLAWLKHQHRNPHHWQYWILLEDCGDKKFIPIPDKYLREMLADWLGAGYAINGKEDVQEWYYKNKDLMDMCPESRRTIEKWIEEKEWDKNRTW